MSYLVALCLLCGTDKPMHAMGSLVGATFLLVDDTVESKVAASAAMMAIGMVKEMTDPVYDVADVRANAVGILAANLMWEF